MSCEDCELSQERVFKGLDGIAYYRWKNANIAIIGCKEHLREMIDYLNKRFEG